MAARKTMNNLRAALINRETLRQFEEHVRNQRKDGESEAEWMSRLVRQRAET